MTLPIRKKNRKQWFDYSSAWWYFVTICTHNRIHYFWDIQNGIMSYTKIWQFAKDFRLNIPLAYWSSVHIDTFVIMPNHIHWIIILHEQAPSISTIIKSYKQQVTKKTHEEDLWFSRQKSFHDHIIRNEEELIKIKEYMINNPLQRTKDRFYTDI